MDDVRTLINEARDAGVTFEWDGLWLNARGLSDTDEMAKKLAANGEEVAKALKAEGICSQCDARPGDAGADANGARWCRVCNDADLLLHAGEIPAKLAGMGLRAVWVGALSELGELCGHPAIKFKPGHSVAPGAANWGAWIAHASAGDMALVLAQLRPIVDALPSPGDDDATAA